MTTDPGIHASNDPYDRPILTVGQLRSILDGLDPNTHVVVADNDGWYLNIALVATPHPDNDTYSCVTVFPGTTFDSRQF